MSDRHKDEDERARESAIAYWSATFSEALKRKDYNRALFLIGWAIDVHNRVNTFRVGENAEREDGKRRSWLPWKEVEEYLVGVASDIAMDSATAGRLAICFGGILNHEIIGYPDRLFFSVPVGDERESYYRYWFIGYSSDATHYREMAVYLHSSISYPKEADESRTAFVERNDGYIRAMGDAKPDLWGEWRVARGS